MFGLEFPPIEHLVVWRQFWFPGFNKVALICVLSAIFTLLLFAIAARGDLVPKGVQNLVEAAVDFVRNDIVLQVMGPDGLPFLPILVSMFFFIFFCNIFEVIPIFQFPASARMAIPLSLAILTYVLYLGVGMVKMGPIKYLKESTIPPGVPKAMLPLIMLIDFLQIVAIRPFSLMVRLFANMLAGHLLLTTFAVLSAALFSKTLLVVILPFSVAMLIALTGFEILVAVLQAFIFTILTAVYLDSSMHVSH